MKKETLIVPFMLRQAHNFPGSRTVETTRCLVKVLGLPRMTVAQIRERIKWFENEVYYSAGDEMMSRAIMMDKKNQGAI